MGKYSMFAAVLLLCGTPVCSFAQADQTAEGAQEFLKMTLPGNRYVPGWLISQVKTWDRNSAFDTRYTYRGTGVIAEVRSQERCKTAILYDHRGISMGENEVNGNTGRRMGWQYYPLDSDRYGLKEFQAGSLAGVREFSWSDVKEVKLAGNETGVLLLLNGVNEYTEIVVGAKDMAARVVYAMEFLRLNCDRAAGTGF